MVNGLDLTAETENIIILMCRTGRHTSGGGFYLICKNLGRMLDHSYPACAFFLSFF